MKKLITAALFLFSGLAVLAQEPLPDQGPEKTPEERTENMTKRLTAELSLTPEQQVKVKEVILKREIKRESEMKKRKAEMEQSDAELKTILTPEQYEKFQKRKAEMKQRRKEKANAQRPNGAGPPPDSKEK